MEEEDRTAFLPALRPLFGDAGFPIDAPHPSRWYLRLPPGAKLPAFAEPDDALGADLFDHLAEGSEGRRWRVLLGEAQVVRSEEHTSGLQSLMRISYAVFCLKKKQHQKSR